MLTLGLRPASNNSQIAWLETDHLAVPIHLASDAARADADYSALWRRLVVEAVERQKLDSVPHLESVTSSHRLAFDLGTTTIPSSGSASPSD